MLGLKLNHVSKRGHRASAGTMMTIVASLIYMEPALKYLENVKGFEPIITFTYFQNYQVKTLSGDERLITNFLQINISNLMNKQNFQQMFITFYFNTFSSNTPSIIPETSICLSVHTKPFNIYKGYYSWWWCFHHKHCTQRLEMAEKIPAAVTLFIT